MTCFRRELRPATERGLPRPRRRPFRPKANLPRRVAADWRFGGERISSDECGGDTRRTVWGDMPSVGCSEPWQQFGPSSLYDLFSARIKAGGGARVSATAAEAVPSEIGPAEASCFLRAEAEAIRAEGFGTKCRRSAILSCNGNSALHLYMTCFRRKLRPAAEHGSPPA